MCASNISTDNIARNDVCISENDSDNDNDNNNNIDRHNDTFDISNTKGLKIAHLNVNSLTKHIDEIRILLAEKPFDVLSINESKIDWSISDSEIFIHNYSVLRHDHNRQGGGVALYIRNSIPYTVRQDLVPESLEMICVEINTKFNRPFLMSTWYRPPNSEIDLFNNFELFLLKCDMEEK